jgi:hypothetical protein
MPTYDSWYTYSSPYTYDYTFCKPKNKKEPAPMPTEPSMRAVDAKERLEAVKERLSEMLLDGTLDDRDIYFLNQGILCYCNSVYSSRMNYDCQVNLGRWDEWAGAKAIAVLTKLGVQKNTIDCNICLPDRINGYRFYACLFDYIDGKKYGATIVNLREFLEGLKGLGENTKTRFYTEPVVCVGVEQWDNNYNPSCECNLCTWASRERHGGGRVQCGMEYFSTCDDELKQLLNREGKDCLDLLDEEDIKNPRLRQLFRENKFDEICEVLEVA